MAPDFKALAQEWLTLLEREYWENDPCNCAKRLEELLRKVYEEGKCGI